MATSTTLIICFSLLCIQTSTVASSTTNCIDEERTAIIKFKASLTDETARLSSWTGQECCSWKGITCSAKTHHVLKLDLHNPTPFDADRFYNAEDSAYVASYSKTCLSGQINPALLHLKNLLFLDLSYNNFSTNEIPKFFGEFESLNHLNLSVARFQGAVPFEIGNISGLQVLDMSDFWFNRLFSNSLKWTSELSSLRHLDLSGVHLTEANDWLDSVNRLPSLTKLNLSNTLIPSIFPLSRPRFTSLVSFDLQWNTIDSELPLWLFNISTLIELRLDGNGFRGRIPEDFVRLPSLSVLGLSRNFFNSSLPNALFTLKNLSYLDLSQNRFQETVPNGFVNLCNLKFLDLTQNGFTGSIPDLGVNQSGCLRDLQILRLAYNSLTGPIPPSIGSLASLKELDISNNVLNSSIPSSIGQLSSLVKLDVSNNSLSGMVSELHFAKLSDLTELSMFQNKLVFKINANWIPPFQLQTVKLTSCTVGPLFPPWLQTQKDVMELRMSRAGISDTLPDWFEKLYSRIHYLDLSINNISGKLPNFEEANRPGRRLILNSNNFDGPLRPLPSDILLFDISNNMVSGSIPPQNSKNLSLEVLILSNNRLNGSLPDFICEIEGLMILDIKNNQFSGQMPDCIGWLQNLAMLDFTNNFLHGEIPKSLANLTLMSLHLRNNSFSGQLPSLENMTYLHILDVAKNSFTGIIPPWIGEKLENLAFLSLQSNEFHGEIPTNLCQLPELQLLNLAGNDIVGSIPPCLGNISTMITGQQGLNPYLTLDVDYGASIFEIVSGMERLYTKTMPFLTSLDLSDNNIAGEIPENLTRLVGLKSLNLAGNGLTGRIPGEIGEMKELVSLDLSRNRLSGRIPQGLSDLNFLSYLNLSFNELSGRIPTGNQLWTMDSSSYLGNEGLCGAPLDRSCDGDPTPPPPPDNDGGGGGGDSLFPWLYAGAGPGLLVGFLVVCGVLHFVESWRFVYFQWIESFVVNK